MHVFRRYALLIAGLAFLTSGPLAAWHVAGEAVPTPACHVAPDVATLADAHGADAATDGLACLVCHLLQHVRVHVTATGLPAAGDGASNTTWFEQVPRDLATAAHLPARAPPTPVLG